MWKSLVVLMALCSSAVVSASIGTPIFAPQPIVAQVPFTVALDFAECDIFPAVGHPVDVRFVAPNRIQLYVTGLHQTEPVLCVAPAGTARFDLPALAAGQYQFEFYLRNLALPGTPIYNGPVASFTVVDQSSNLNLVPALNIGGEIVLILGVIGLVRMREKG